MIVCVCHELLVCQPVHGFGAYVELFKWSNDSRIVIVIMCAAGSVLSPTLFSIYLDSLSVKLSASGVGCTFNSKCFNHLVYADDTVLLAPSPKALQQSLINICVLFAN